MPVLAATCAFVTYTATAHDFDVAIIFSSLSLFQLLRQPLMFLPRSLSAMTDAQNALVRLRKVFMAETTDPRDAFVVDENQKHALEVKDATFTWEDSKTAADVLGNRPGHGKGAKSGEKKGEGKERGEKDSPSAGPPFQVKNVTMLVPRGSLVAVVGTVGRYVGGPLDRKVRTDG